MTLDKFQEKAVEMAMESRILCFTGGPGTGKTTTVREIITRLESAGKTIVLAAPTGKAAKRMQEQTGKEASTIHRLLKWSPNIKAFMVNSSNPIPADAVIVDEVSMVGVPLMASLLDAIQPSTKLILVGDADQLPSIEAGNVLRDIIDSGAVPVVRLTHVYRQSENSWICLNAQRINRGEMVHIDNERSEDFFFYECEESTEVAEKILKLVTKIISQRYGLDPIKDIQVLCPQWRGNIGVHYFNAELQNALNPKALGKEEWNVKGEGAVLREGDKVIHTKNNYDLGVYNGEVGIVKNISKDELIVDFDDKVVSYDRESVHELILSYALTIHKSQGSEYPCVVIPVHSYNSFMLSRPLLYTAVTRGKRFVFLVGDMKGLKRAIKNNDVVERYTSLDEFLTKVAHG